MKQRSKMKQRRRMNKRRTVRKRKKSHTRKFHLRGGMFGRRGDAAAGGAAEEERARQEAEAEAELWQGRALALQEIDLQFTMPEHMKDYRVRMEVLSGAHPDCPQPLLPLIRDREDGSVWGNLNVVTDENWSNFKRDFALSIMDLGVWREWKQGDLCYTSFMMEGNTYPRNWEGAIPEKQQATCRFCGQKSYEGNITVRVDNVGTTSTAYGQQGFFFSDDHNVKKFFRGARKKLPAKAKELTKGIVSKRQRLLQENSGRGHQICDVCVNMELQRNEPGGAVAAGADAVKYVSRIQKELYLSLIHI